MEDQSEFYQLKRNEEASSAKKAVNGSKTQSGRKEFSKNNGSADASPNIEINSMMNGLESIESHPQEEILSLEPSSVIA